MLIGVGCVKLMLDLAKELAQAHAQRAGDPPRCPDTGSLSSASNHGEMASGDSGEIGQHLLGHATFCPQPVDHLAGELTVVRHEICSFAPDRQSLHNRTIFREQNSKRCEMKCLRS